MTSLNSIVVAGIDVGKSKLDAHILEGSLERQFNNDQCGRRALRNWLLKHGVTRAVLEPTGRYHRNLHRGLFDAGIETVLGNPLRSRRFAEAIGKLAKNDRVEAAMRARFGLLDGLEATPPQPHNLQLLSDLLALPPQAPQAARRPPQALRRTRPRGRRLPRYHARGLPGRQRRL